MTPAKLEAELDNTVRLPGVVNAWTMPIKARVDMLSTGIRTPVGIKIFGAKSKTVERDRGKKSKGAIRSVRGTRNVFAERVTGGYYVDFKIKRDQIARYGLSVQDVEMVIESAIGGANVTTTIEGRERFPVNVRYQRYRSDVNTIQRTLISTPGGLQIPINQVADVSLTTGPTVIRTEQAQLLGYVYVDVADRDIGGYVGDAKQVVARMVKLPEGYYLSGAGNTGTMQRAKERLTLVIPVTLLIVLRALVPQLPERGLSRWS